MIHPITPEAIAATARGGYMNRVISRINDHDIHISVMHAPYAWHIHPDSDETFIGVEGTLLIDFDDGAVELHPGQVLTVPAGTRHRTRPLGARSVNLTVERSDTATVRCD
ncbi:MULTISPECIES: cupin domain-containing protein [unclassified Caballeronia]|uniref:cupin domain-containing protein n=1 Tax=unclassified Caballeronia TaxID=2646786 RepID=UPI0028649523|nr:MULTISPECIES: cupin domain-containing protein [unclassified Caballeronia]MDR5740910.1 cupin domain-containing protein [Caballeronia sp. LZ016]MDR5808569.1 cupin domain-containing protein [Caballeronia sp. LZ019]